MTLQLQLSPEAETELRTRASAAGRDVATFILEMLNEKLAPSPLTNGEIPAEQWVAQWRAWAANHPTLSTEADDSRDSIYAGRGE